MTGPMPAQPDPNGPPWACTVCGEIPAGRVFRFSSPLGAGFQHRGTTEDGKPVRHVVVPLSVARAHPDLFPWIGGHGP
jgi:hypothetical protein